MGRHGKVGRGPQRAVVRQWFLRIDVQHRTGDLPVVQRSQQRCLVDGPAATEIHEPGRRLHGGEEGRIEKVFGVWRQRHHRYHPVCLGHRRHRAGRGKHLAEHGIAAAAAASGACYLHANRFQQPADFMADAAGAEHDCAAALQLVRQPEVPRAGRLHLEGCAKPLHLTQHVAKHVLGHGPVEDAARIGQHGVTFGKRGKQDGVDARAAPVDPLEPAGMLPLAFKVAAAEVPAQQDVAVFQMLCQLVRVRRKRDFSNLQRRIQSRHVFHPAGAAHNDLHVHSSLTPSGARQSARMNSPSNRLNRSGFSR